MDDAKRERIAIELKLAAYKIAKEMAAKYPENADIYFERAKTYVPIK